MKQRSVRTNRQTSKCIFCIVTRQHIIIFGTGNGLYSSSCPQGRRSSTRPAQLVNCKQSHASTLQGVGRQQKQINNYTKSQVILRAVMKIKQEGGDQALSLARSDLTERGSVSSAQGREGGSRSPMVEEHSRQREWLVQSLGAS